VKVSLANFTEEVRGSHSVSMVVDFTLHSTHFSIQNGSRRESCLGHG